MMYITSIDKYLDFDGIISQEEVDFFDALEREWKKTLPNDNFNALVKRFPESKVFLKEQIETCKNWLKKNEKVRRDCEDLIYRKVPKEKEEFWAMIAEELIICPKEEEQVKKIIKRNRAILSPLQSKVIVDEEKIARAKEYPIEELLEFKQNKTRCIFHNERSASLNYYPDNHVYCFGCNKSADSIAVYQQLNNCDFKTAVLQLQ